MVIRLRIARSFLGSTNVLSPEELKRLVHLFLSGLTLIPRKVNQGTSHYKFVRRGPTLSGVGGYQPGYGRHHLSHEHYPQNFIGFKISVETEIFS